MSLSDEQTDSVVQTSVPEAGGQHGPHRDEKTLDEAGLKVPDQRRSFRRRCSINVEGFNHTLQTTDVPCDATTKIGDAKKAVKEKARPR